MTFDIPHIQVKAKYRSSGVLILVRASGAGDYWGEYGKQSIDSFNTHKISLNKTITMPFHSRICWHIDGVRAKVYFKAVPVDVQDGLTYLRVEESKMDFTVKEIEMGVDNVAGGNPVIRKTIAIFQENFPICWTKSCTAVNNKCWHDRLILHSPDYVSSACPHSQRPHWTCSSIAIRRSCSKRWNRPCETNSPWYCTRSSTACSRASHWSIS